MNVFAEMVYSVTSPRRYPEFFRDKKFKTFGFGFLLVLIYFLITIIVPLGRFQVETGGVVEMVNTMVPRFTIKDREVHVSEPIEYSDGDIYIYVDTEHGEIDREKLRLALRNYDQALVLDSSQAVVKNNGQTRFIAYEELDPDLVMTKESLLVSLSSMVNMIIGVGLVVIFVGMELLFFFGVLFVALLGMIVASCMQYHLTFGQLYKLGIYTRTLPVLIKAALSFLPFGVPFYTVISIMISLLYLSAAIRHMKAPGLTNGPLSFTSDTVGPQNQGNGQTGPNMPSWNGRKDEFDNWNRPYNG